MTVFSAESFVNSIDQTLVPGDDVIAVKTSGDRTTVAKGTYLGVRKQGDKVTGVTISYPAKRFKFDRETRSGHYEDVLERSTLPLKRVYKIA